MFFILYGCLLIGPLTEIISRLKTEAFLLINRRGKAQRSVPTQSCSKASKYFDNWTSPST